MKILPKLELDKISYSIISLNKYCIDESQSHRSNVKSIKKMRDTCTTSSCNADNEYLSGYCVHFKKDAERSVSPLER